MTITLSIIYSIPILIILGYMYLIIKLLVPLIKSGNSHVHIKFLGFELTLER